MEYEKDGGITIACTCGEWKMHLLSDDLFPSDNGYIYKITVDVLYRGLQHLGLHALNRSLVLGKEKEDGNGSSVRS